MRTPFIRSSRSIFQVFYEFPQEMTYSQVKLSLSLDFHSLGSRGNSSYAGEGGYKN